MSSAAHNGHRVVVITLKGEFDLAQRDRLADAFAIAGSGDVVVLNLEGTTYIDSTVLTQMIQLRNELSTRSARLVLACANRSVQRLLDVSQLAGLFSIQERLQDVVADTEPAHRITVIGDLLP